MRQLWMVIVVLALAVLAALLSRDEPREQRTTMVPPDPETAPPDPRLLGADGVDNAPTLEGRPDAKPAQPKKAAAVRKAQAHAGEFRFHYRQGYSFLERRVVEAAEVEDADLVLEHLAGGTSSVALRVPGGRIASAVSLRAALKVAKTALGLHDALIRGHPDALAKGDQAHGDSRRLPSDVFLLQTRRGEWVKLAIVHRDDSGRNWQRFKITIAYDLRPDEPVFLSGSGDVIGGGFEFSTALISDRAHPLVAQLAAAKAQRLQPYERFVRRLDERAAELERAVRAAGGESHRVAAVVMQEHASELGRDDAYTAATYSFEHVTRDDAKKTRNDWDFRASHWNGQDWLWIRTVTDDRGLAWDLGRTTFERALRGEVAPAEGVERIRPQPDHLYLIHTLDAESDYWTLVKVLESAPGQSLIFEWVRVADPAPLRRALGTSSKDLQQPYARLQLRSDHGGGNPHRAFLDGSKNAYVRELASAPLDLRERQERAPSAAYVEGGTVPEGRAFLVESVEVTIHLDEPGRVQSLVQVGAFTVLAIHAGGPADKLELITIDRGLETLAVRDLPLRRTFRVRIPILRDQEKSVYVEGASHTRADVQLRGRLVDASGKPTGCAKWNDRDHHRARSALRHLLTRGSAPGWIEKLDGHETWLRALREHATNDDYRRELDTWIEALRK